MSVSRQIAIGAFLIGGLFLFAVGLFWIGDRRQLFTESVDLYTQFTNVSGLSRGAKVRVSGLDAGEVLEIQIPGQPDLPYRVHFRAVSGFVPILRMDSVASIQNDGLVGNKFLQVDAGTSSAATVKSGVTIPSREPVEISDILAQAKDTVKTANLAILDIRTGIDQTVKAVLSLNEETTEVVSDVGKQVDRFASTGNVIADDVKGIVADVRRGQGSIGKLVTDNALYDQLRSVASQGQQVTENFKDVSSDLKAVSDDLKSRNFGAKIDTVADSVNTLTKQATVAVQSLTNPDGASGGLMSEVRQMLTSANEGMSNFAESSEALKRNFLFRGFFNQRGFFDLGTVTVRDYQEGRFLPDRQKVSEWVEATQLFASSTDGREQITDEGKRKLDLTMAGFLRYAKTDPLIIESWAGAGNEPERVLRSRQRAIMVSEYLIKKFDLKPGYVAAMPMNAAAPSPGGQNRDGIGLVLFPPKMTRR